MTTSFVGFSAGEGGRARIVVEDYVCAYCGGEIDPGDPSAHVSLCPKHPVVRYRRTIESFAARVEEVAASLGRVEPVVAAAALRDAVEEARSTLTPEASAGGSPGGGFWRTPP